MKAMIVAGEPSGDLYGGRLSSALLRNNPSLTIAGMGGEQMDTAGVSLLYHYRHITVIGVFEVFSKLRKLRNAYDRLVEWVRRNRPDFVVLIDFPDFNFRLARFLKKEKIPVFYFISPQIWAWRKGRIDFLKEHVDLMISILPFEKALYEQREIPVVYVGHPLPLIVREELAKQEPYAQKNAPRIGLMPGSRNVEVRRHLPILIETLNIVRKTRPIDSVLIWAPSLNSADYAIPDWLKLESANRYSAISSCDLVLVASGTSTLECAILGVPLFIVYRVGTLTWWLGKLLVRVPYYGLVNWIAQEKRIPEYIQNRMNPSLLSQDVSQFLRDPEASERMKISLKEIVALLETPDPIEQAVASIFEKLQDTPPRTR